MYDFQERMAEGRAAAKRSRERYGSSPYEAHANERQRFASMSDDDWQARELEEASWANELAEAVDAAPAWRPDPVNREVKPSRKRPTFHPNPTGVKGMTEREYVRLCKKLGLSPGYSAAKALGISVTTAQRYRDGTWPVSETVAKLLKAMVKLGTTDI
jgi:hypothetical protein